MTSKNCEIDFNYIKTSLKLVLRISDDTKVTDNSFGHICVAMGVTNYDLCSESDIRENDVRSRSIQQTN